MSSKADDNKIKESLSKSGFQLEAEVARYIGDGWEIVQNAPYFDADEQKERSIDILALGNKQEALAAHPNITILG